MKMTIDECMRLGAAAETLKASPEFQAVVGAVQAEAFRDWHNSNPEELTKREASYYLMSATKKFTENLDVMIQNAKLVEHKLEEQKAEQSREAKNDEGETS